MFVACEMFYEEQVVIRKKTASNEGLHTICEILRNRWEKSKDDS